MIEFRDLPGRIDEDVAHDVGKDRRRRFRLAHDGPGLVDDCVAVHDRDRVVRDIDLDSPLAHVARLPAPHFHIGEDRRALSGQRAEREGRVRGGGNDPPAGRSLRAPAALAGLRIGGLSSVRSGAARRRLGQPLQLFAQLAISLLRRVEIGEQPSRIRRRGGLGQRRAGFGDARRRPEHWPNARRRDARPGRLFGVGCHGRGDGRLSLRQGVRGEAGPNVSRERELRKIKAVVAGAFELREDGASGLGQAVFADPHRRVVALGVEGRNRGARSAPVARAERVRLIRSSDEPLDRRLERDLQRR